MTGDKEQPTEEEIREMRRQENAISGEPNEDDE
jgi:hypothetical protein